ncbi:Lrp/AsnC family transcriptional regulator [Cypionkella sp.]|uniref:Lrp/AsnC family transcriptional regulator n=1 Tax=Cypionkella sp. TaxID=2811411 RepID=UPI003753BD88
MGKMDHIDRSLLRALQRDGSLSQRDLADQVGMSQNACGRRLKALQEAGVIKGYTIRLDAKAVALGLTVFVMIRTRHHSKVWLESFRKEVLAIQNVVDFYRIAGDYDYMLKVIAEDMNDFDRVYQRLIARLDLDAVASLITMEQIADNRDWPV